MSLKNSYLDPKYVYKNDLISFKSVSDLKKFISMYPNFKDELESYLDINLVRNAKYAYELRNLNLPRDILNYLDKGEVVWTDNYLIFNEEEFGYENNIKFI